MKPFAQLLDRLLYTPQRSVKLALILDYLRTVPDPDRGWGLAALTGGLSLGNAKPGLVRALAARRSDPVLFAWSYDFVGDLAETTALLWPEPPAGAADWPHLAEVIATLETAPRAELPAILAGWLDRLDATGRWALLKLVTGALRVGVSARLAKTALAAYGAVEVGAIEEVWHGQAPPYTALFAWLDGRGPRPADDTALLFRPLMLAHPLEAEADRAAIAAEPDAWLAEWKWDGIRVQLAVRDGTARLYARSGDEISQAFPEILEGVAFTAVLDGELLVGRPGPDGLWQPAPFAELQQRLNRKAPSPALREALPAFVRLYDLLREGDEDLRPLPFATRRARLEALLARHPAPRLDLSPLIPFTSLAELAALRDGARAAAREGLMLKRKDSPYLAGRVKGPWWKWKRDPHALDVVLMYAQRGHGKRSSFYSDYTFGCWRDGPDGAELVPVGKAYFGFTDEELRRLDRWVREHTVRRYGPVREVAPALVLEVAFDAVQRSARHKSGVAMRFPRVARIRWDKPAPEADRLETLERLIG